MKEAIRKLARESLIDEIRFMDAEDLNETHIGTAGLFASRQPRAIMPEAKSVILVSMYIGKFVSPATNHHGRLSRLVLSGFYANIVKPLLPIQAYLEAQGYRAVVMTGAYSEGELPIKAAAVKAGLGWIGKNTLLVSEKYGTFQALGAIVTDAELGEENQVVQSRCGSCTKCQDACPANAISEPRHLNRPRCLSYILDGDEGEISLADVDLQGYFLECDICQDHCPWNQQHIKAPLRTPYGDLYKIEDVEPLLRLEQLATMDEETYHAQLEPWFGDVEIPYAVFRRNVSVVERNLHEQQAKK